MSDNSVNQALFSLKQPLDVVVMAAGKGTRMKSRLPKVLQRLAGKPLLGHVLDTAAHLNARSAVVITGHGADEVEAAVSSVSGKLAIKFVFKIRWYRSPSVFYVKHLLVVPDTNDVGLR